MASAAPPIGPATGPRPEVGDILVVIHDFVARSSDELSLAKGDRVELVERDDEFGDGWFLGKHLVNGGSGLFPEVYTRPAPKGIIGVANAVITPKSTLATLPETPAAASAPSPAVPDATAPVSIPPAAVEPQTTTAATAPIAATTTAAPVAAASPVTAAPDTLRASTTVPVLAPTPEQPTSTLPLSSFKSSPLTSSLPAKSSSTNTLPTSPPLGGAFVRPSTSQGNHVISDTLNVIDEHITDLRSTPSNGGLRSNTDSESEYSLHMDNRMSYIQGEETDEEEEDGLTRAEVSKWSADGVAEYLFTQGVEKHHCEVFRDQEITGEVLLDMDQTSLFIKAFDLGSVGRRLKTWQKIKQLQDDVNGQGPSTRRTTQTYGSDVGSDDARRSTRSRTNTLTNSVQKLPPINDGHPLSVQTKRLSMTQTASPLDMDSTPLVSPVSPGPTVPIDSPSRPRHEKRPSAASVRDLHHSRRHSSTDFRLTGTTVNTTGTPKLAASGTFPQSDVSTHKKQPSFDRNWTLGGASAYNHRPLSSTGFQDILAASEADQNSANADLDRGYFSGTDVDGRRRNVLKKREGSQSHSRNTSYAEEQRVRSGTALSRHSRFGSVDSTRDQQHPSAAQKYHSLTSSTPHPHRRTLSTATDNRPTLRDAPAPTVTKLDGRGGDARISPISPASGNKQTMPGDWLSMPGLKSTLGLRTTSDAVTNHERSKLGSSLNEKESPLHSPSRTGSTTPSGGPSFELDSPDAKSPSTAATTTSQRSAKKKTKQETSAYQRGLQKISPREAVLDADYSGWMKKKSSNLMTTWKPRLFVLKGRRLAYYYSDDDQEEKGLIDISFHRVLAADNERLTGLHATLTGASNSPVAPAGSQVTTLAATEAAADTTRASDAMFIFKLVPPRAGLSRAVNFTKPTVHYFAVPNIKQGRLWMAALMKATIDRDDTQPITSSYQQKTISLAKARQMRHRPPALMNLDEKMEDIPDEDEPGSEQQRGIKTGGDANGLGIIYDGNDSGVSGLDKGNKANSGRRQFSFEAGKDTKLPMSA